MIIYLYSLPNSLTLSHSDTNMIFLKSCNYYKDFCGCNYDWSIWSQIIPLFLFVTEILKTIFIWVGFSTWLSKLKTYDWAPLSLSFCNFPRDTISLSLYEVVKAIKIKTYERSRYRWSMNGATIPPPSTGRCQILEKVSSSPEIESHIIHVNTKMERLLKLF